MNETWVKPNLQIREDSWAILSQAIHKLDLACSPWPGTAVVPSLISVRIGECEEALDMLRLTWGL